MKYLSCGEADTLGLSARLGERLVGGEVILLTGGLGCGKTVFSKGIARGMGVKDTVTSPTFVVMNVYESGRLRLCHCDAYRIFGQEDAESVGLADFLGRADTVCLIEWPQNIAFLLGHLPVIEVEISYTGDNTREITIEGLPADLTLF